MSKDLPLRLKRAREQAGLSQGQVASLLGYKRPTISEIEAGRRKVRADELEQFAEMYDVEETWLLGVTAVEDPIVELAARELAKLKKEDIETVLDLLKSMRRRNSGA